MKQMQTKIALCFLTYGNLSQPDLWKPFVHPKYSIYIHNKDKFSGQFEQYCIENRIATKHSDISLVKATLLLFKEAFKNTENAYFVLLSDMSIPLYSPGEIHDQVKGLGSDVLLNSCHKNMERYDTLADKTFFEKSAFVKQHQWMLLKRDTVRFLIENDYTHIFGAGSNVPDEHYFINVMQKFNIPFINRGTTFVNWQENSDLKKYRARPKTYSTLTEEMLQGVWKSGALFMRKIGPECNIPNTLISRINSCGMDTSEES